MFGICFWCEMCLYSVQVEGPFHPHDLRDFFSEELVHVRRLVDADREWKDATGCGPWTLESNGAANSLRVPRVRPCKEPFVWPSLFDLSRGLLSHWLIDGDCGISIATSYVHWLDPKKKAARTGSISRFPRECPFPLPSTSGLVDPYIIYAHKRSH